MFAFEDLSQMISLTQRQIHTPLAGDLRFYSRLTLVTLLHLAKSRVLTEWAKCVDVLLQKIENDRSLILGSNNLQELYLHLYMSGLWENPALEVNPRASAIRFGTSRPVTGETGLLQHYDIPSVVYVVLVVPRSKLGVFDEPLESTGTPGLHISVSQQGMFENCFFGIDCCFGQLKAVPNSVGVCDLEEDKEGWQGRGNLLAICPVPAFSLLAGPRKGIRVALVVNSTPVYTARYLPKLGLKMEVYGCGLDDEKHLRILREAPGPCESPHDVVSKIYAQPEDPIPTTFLRLDHQGTVRSISIRMLFSKGAGECNSLKNKATVEISQLSSCTLALRIGDCSHHLAYPYPIDGSRHKVKIAREMSWVEVEAPICPTLIRGNLGFNQWPVVFHASHPVSWSLGRTNINQQPVIPAAGKLDWLRSHLGAVMSVSERHSVEAQHQSSEKVSGLTNIKESISLISLSFVGHNPDASRKKFNGFILTTENSCDTLVFAKSMRHDCNTGSILLDRFVVPLHDRKTTEFRDAIAFAREKLLVLKISDGGSVLWRQLLPALVERCKDSWEHKDVCKYILSNTVPLSTASGRNPVCSCGEDKDAADFPIEFASLKKLATRIALLPLFSVPYVESTVPRELPQAMLQAVPWQLRGPDTANHARKDTCSHCGIEREGLKRCLRCEKAMYCNHACQKAAWKAHKKECGRLIYGDPLSCIF